MKFSLNKIIVFLISVVFSSNAIAMRPINTKDIINEDIFECFHAEYDCRYLKNLTRKRITPDNTIFAFDLHEVLFNRCTGTMIWGGLKLFFKAFFFMLFHPLFVWDLISVCCEEMVCEGMYVKLQTNYPYLKNWENDIFEISNYCCSPEPTMIALLKILKQQGFKLFLLSNIGADTLVDFRKRFDCFENLFDGFYTPSRTNNYSYKPIIGFYEGFKKYLKSLGHEDKQVIFIDDIERNIVGASHVGISGIHFVGYESLCETLHKIGICVNQPLNEDTLT